MSTTKKPRPVLEPEAAPWISISKKHYAALQHEEVLQSKKVLQNEGVVSWIWEYSYLFPLSKVGLDDVQAGVEDAHHTQKWRPEIFTPPEPWDVITQQIESPLASSADHISCSNPQSISSHATISSVSRMNLGTGFTVRVTSAMSRPPPNFSRPLPRPSISDPVSPESGPEIVRRKPRKYKRRWIKDLFRCMLERPKSACSTYENSPQLPIHRDLADYGYDPRTTLRPPGNHLGNPLQPPGQLPVETLRPPSRKLRKTPPTTDRVPKHPLRPPEQIPPEVTHPPRNLPAQSTRHKSGRFNEDLPPPDSQPRHTAARLISKLKDKITLSRRGSNLGASNEAAIPAQKQTTAIKPDVDHFPSSSWSSNIKNCLQSLPLGNKNGREDIDGRHPVESLRAPIQEDHSLDATCPLRQDCNRSPSATLHTIEKESRRFIALTADSKIHTASSSQTSHNKSYLSVSLPVAPLVVLEPFQCTFCLLQCGCKEEWLEHEKSLHFQDPEQTIKQLHPVGEVDNQITQSASSKGSRARRLLRKLRSSSTHRGHAYERTRESNHPSLLEHPQGWYWICGFCGTLFCSWDERQSHLAERHFERGETMSLWDPTKSPYPWRRGSAAPTTASSWDLPSLLSELRPTLIDSINQLGDPPEQEHSCAICQIPHRSLAESARHTKLWHTPRDTRSCPTIRSTTNLNDFFDADDDEDGNTTDMCYACGDWLPRPDYLDRDTRMQHLKEVHNFREWACLEKCGDKDQFFLHLANAHRVEFGRIKGIMEICKVDGKPLSLVTEDANGGV